MFIDFSEDISSSCAFYSTVDFCLCDALIIPKNTQKYKRFALFGSRMPKGLNNRSFLRFLPCSAKIVWYITLAISGSFGCLYFRRKLRTLNIPSKLLFFVFYFIAIFGALFSPTTTSMGCVFWGRSFTQSVYNLWIDNNHGFKCFYSCGKLYLL